MGSTDLISFTIRIRKPRREYVGLGTQPFPSDYLDFTSYVEEAAGDAYIQHIARYGVRPREMEMLVQHQKTTISRLRVQVSPAGKVSIRQWGIGRDSPIFEVFLQWRYLQRGLFQKYFEKRDRVETWPSSNIERVIFSTNPVGLLTEEQVMNAQGHKPELPKSEEESIFDKMRSQAFRIG